jgi:ATP synthase protein I
MANRTRPTVTTFQALAVASQFGITLAVSVVLGVLAGQWLDGRLNTGIIFTLIGVLLGLVAAATNTVRLYRALLRKTESHDDVGEGTTSN